MVTVALCSALIAGAPATGGASPVQTQRPPDWAEVQQAFGRTGAVTNGVLRVTFPRLDLHVHIGSVAVDPALALTSWVALQRVGEGAMLMGDLVLLDSETEGVTARLVARGLEVTALHNHLLHEAPRVMFLHVGGVGDPVDLARNLMTALALTNTPLGAPKVQPAAAPLDWAPVEKILGRAGHRTGRVIQFSVPRAEPITMHGRAIPPESGVAHVINLQAVGQQAATTGDLVLLAGEVNPVVRALGQSGIAVTAVHNHMLTEAPRLFFLHFWGVDQPQRLAQGLKLALDQTSSGRGR